MGGDLFLCRKTNSSFRLRSSFFILLNLNFCMSSLLKSADPSKVDSWRVGWTILTPGLINSHSQVRGPESEPSCCYIDAMDESFQNHS